METSEQVEASDALNAATTSNPPEENEEVIGPETQAHTEERTPSKRTGSVKLGRNQRQGISQVSEKRARLDPETPDSGNCSGIAFNALARAVVTELRKARDIEDGFGRKKDTICIDRAFKTPEELQNPSKSVTVQGSDEMDEFCGECGIPLLPDPKPEQLFIYLHAFRYVILILRPVSNTTIL